MLPSSKYLMTNATQFLSPSPLLYFTSGRKYLRQNALVSRNFHTCFPDKALVQRKGSSFPVPFAAKTPVSGEDDRRALETVLRLYTAIKNRNLHELSDVIGDECRCVCNLNSCFHPSDGKKQVLELFSFLMGYMGKHIEFVVKPTLHDGMNVGVVWSLEWEKTHVPLGQGFSFYMCHTYKGKVVIRNMEMFMEPLLHIGPLRLKMLGVVMNVLDKIGYQSIIKCKGKKSMLLLVALIFIVATFFLSKTSLF